jgi:hypothetical protein
MDSACFFSEDAKAFRTFVRIFSPVKSERLMASLKLALHKALIRSVMTYAYPAWELAADTPPLKIASPAKRGLSAPLDIFQGAHRPAICVQLSTFHMCTIIKQNCAGNKQKSSMRMNMFSV